MNAAKRSDTHGPASDAEAYDLLAAWIRRGPRHAREVEKAWSHDDGSVEVVLRHELCETEIGPRSHARSVTQRTLASAIRSALAIASYNGAR